MKNIAQFGLNYSQTDCNSDGVALNAKTSDAMEWAQYVTGSCNGCQDFNKGLCYVIGELFGRCKDGSSWGMFYQCQDTCGKCKFQHCMGHKETEARPSSPNMSIMVGYFVTLIYRGDS